MHKIIYLFVLLFVSGFAWSQEEMWNVCPLKVGEEVPDSKLMNLDGDTVSLTKIISNDKVVVVFFRGGWCPYCTRHLSALQEVKGQMDSLGYTLIAVTVDNISNSKKVINKKDLDYQLYADVNGETIDNFGISFQLPEKTIKKYKNSYSIDLEKKSVGGHTKLPVPAVYVIEEGKVKFQYVNPDYSQRLSPKVLLGMLQ